MRTFEVQSIEIDVPKDRLFAFVRDPQNLPSWAQAFQSADAETARLETPNGAVDIGLQTEAHAGAGTIDWRLEFPDGAVALAQSRATETARGSSIYSFVLHAPPVPLEQIEGALDAQSKQLQEELQTLKRLLEA